MSIIDDHADDYMEISGLENWKDIKGWEGLYQVSDLGRVRSLDRYINQSCRDQVIGEDKNGFPIRGSKNKDVFYKGKMLVIGKSRGKQSKVNLIRNTERKSFSLAKLVYCTFNDIDIDTFSSQMGWIDGDVTNNRLKNLQISQARTKAQQLVRKMQLEGIPATTIFDLMNKLENKVGTDGVTLAKKVKDIEQFIFDFVEEQNIGFDIEDDEYRTIKEFNLIDFFYWIQKKKGDK